MIFPRLGRIVSRCDTGVGAAEQITASGAGLVLLDLALPGMSGWEVLKNLRGGGTKYPAVLLMSAHCSSEDLQRARKEGANGFITKRSGPLEWKAAIETICSGGGWWPDSQSPEQAETILSSRESEVRKLLQQGFRSKEIADKLNISPRTVEVHRKNIKLRLGI